MSARLQRLGKSAFPHSMIGLAFAYGLLYRGVG